MNIIMTGSKGLIGSALTCLLGKESHRITRLVRSAPEPGELSWNPDRGTIDGAKLEGFDAVIHLGGDPIAEGRWNEAKKARIRDSRIRNTRLLAETVASLQNTPEVFLCASAVGFYGNRGDTVLNEDSPAGSGFLAEVGTGWEAACEPLRKRGIRVVNLRFGIVLSPKGGALKKMLPPFRLGLGGSFGNGRQYISWISLDDAAGAVRHALLNSQVSGPVNVVSPSPVTNAEFSRILGKTLHRPAVLPVPAFAVRLLFGEMADETLLASTRAEPAKLIKTGYSFRHPDLETALRRLLN
ncbi:MAG: TIGR01777 family oxidoreductase [Candidatus Omnitrophica bacterium]|nr:TIGR01777 family oxidoreductase [Candidatus Omnitrophota bacterium]